MIMCIVHLPNIRNAFVKDCEAVIFCCCSLPMAASDREQLKIELQQVNQQISQQTQMHSMEVCTICY